MNLHSIDLDPIKTKAIEGMEPRTVNWVGSARSLDVWPEIILVELYVSRAKLKIRPKFLFGPSLSSYDLTRYKLEARLSLFIKFQTRSSKSCPNPSPYEIYETIYYKIEIKVVDTEPNPKASFF